MDEYVERECDEENAGGISPKIPAKIVAEHDSGFVVGAAVQFTEYIPQPGKTARTEKRTHRKSEE